MTHKLSYSAVQRKRSTVNVAYYYYQGKGYTKVVQSKAEAIRWRKALWARLDIVDVTDFPLERLVSECMEVKDGVLYWTINDTTGTKLVGKVVGHGSTKGGYNQIILAGSSIYYHRAVWLCTHGKLPDYQIDHIDHDKKNNRIENLQDVTQRENLHNKSKQKNNTSGHTGITLVKSGGVTKFTASIKCDNTLHHLGTFKAVESAIMAREVAKATLGFTASHGH